MDESGVDQVEVVESMQMGETRRVLIEALSEKDSVYEIPENRDLKQNWIDEAIERLHKPIQGDLGKVVSHTDAHLSVHPERGFVAAYLGHLGSQVKVETIKDYLNGSVKLRTIPDDQIDSSETPNIFWIQGLGGDKKLASKTKIDGVTALLDMQGVGQGPETMGVVHPILHIATK